MGGIIILPPVSLPSMVPCSRCLQRHGFIVGYMAVLLAFVFKAYEYTSQLYFRLCRDGDMRILVADNFQHLRGVQRFHVFTILGLAEAGFHHLCDVLLLHVVQVHLLNTGNLLVVEPIGGIQRADFVQHLGIQLLVVNVTRIVNQLPIGNSQADVATASCSIRQRVRIVGSRDKGSIAGTVVL